MARPLTGGLKRVTDTIERALLSGDEAIARGAFEAGISVATAYPGTPSTEILEAIGEHYGEIDSQWSPNEKAAMEVALGASMGGGRALVATKHVGLNVAADPLFTSSYTGVVGALVVVTADDPSLHSSQNEQDNRWYARAAKLPMIEPSDSQEAKDFVAEAVRISEEFDTPVLLRITTRIAHSKTVVELGEPGARREISAFEPRRDKFVMIPAYARQRHVIVEERLRALEKYSETAAVNRIEEGSLELGIVTSGIAYQYVKEAFPEASVLKLGLTHPLPEKLIRKFAASLGRVVVIEELDDILTTEIRAMGIDVAGKAGAFRLGELNVERVRAIADGAEAESRAAAAKVRPPALCPGCPHRAAFHVLKKCKAIVTGDIGCYTLSVLPPLEMMESCVCMGASIGMAFGLRKVLPGDDARRVVGVIGDSTFFHSGVTGVIDAVYNGADGVIVVMDNRTTAMTGGQGHAGTGETLSKGRGREIGVEALCRGIGVAHVVSLDPFEIEKLEEELDAAFDRKGVTVIVTRRPCVLFERPEYRGPVQIDAEKCRLCGRCMTIGCRAVVQGDEAMEVDARLCVSCGLCVQVCPFDAMYFEEE